jgi:hypothetical protein
LVKYKSIPLSPTGLLKMRPDLFTSNDVAKKVLSRSIVSNPSGLLSMPPSYKASLYTVEFKAQNNGRWNTHRHLFLADIDSVERLDGARHVQQTIGTVPWYRWKALIEGGDPLIEGSGWGTVRDFRLVQP